MGSRHDHGILYPARLPTFHREPADPSVADFVRWFWIPEWDLAPGRTSRQQLISFPACNLVVEADAVVLAGPTTKAGHRDLTGRGWAVGALLRPAAVGALEVDPVRLRDAQEIIDLHDLHTAVSAAMMSGDGHRDRAVAAFTTWARHQFGTPTAEALLANHAIQAAEADANLLSVTDLAERVGTSVRTLQRLCNRYVGLSPAALIRRRRLQDAAERVRSDPAIDLADLAAELGYSDHAHLTADFRTALGFTPSTYRSQITDPLTR